MISMTITSSTEIFNQLLQIMNTFNAVIFKWWTLSIQLFSNDEYFQTM